MPLDALSEEELLSIVRHMEIAYYPRGDIIMRRGSAVSEYLYVLNNEIP